MHKVKWGVLSTANIGVAHVIPAMQQGKYTEITGIASRSIEKASQAASKLDIPKWYGSYEEILEDEEIVAVYNPLPNHLHVPLTVQALEAGKHVLCEKPIAMNFDEAVQLQNTAKKFPKLKVMEAFMYRFHPQWKKVKDWSEQGLIGNIQTIHSVFTYFNDDPDNIRNKPEMGGGGLMDIGCYCISASRYLFETEPVDVLGKVDIDPEFGVDRLASGILEFPNGTATFSCSTKASTEQHLTIMGTKGLIEMSIPFNPHEKRAKISLKKEGETVREEYLQANQYTLQGDAFSKSILDDTEVPASLDDAVANMRVIDALKAS